jgi:hypothetical protein
MNGIKKKKKKIKIKLYGILSLPQEFYFCCLF